MGFPSCPNQRSCFRVGDCLVVEHQAVVGNRECAAIYVFCDRDWIAFGLTYKMHRDAVR